jgi:hypothetical protein
MNKADNLRNPASCLNKAEPDEPLFVLRAKDPVAAQAVRHWATMSDGNHEPEKIAQALKAADEMERWRANRFPGVADAPAAVPSPLVTRTRSG